MQKHFKYSTQKLTDPASLGEGRPARAQSSHGSLKTLDSINHCHRIKRRRPKAKKLDKTGEPENVSQNLEDLKALEGEQEETLLQA